MAETVSIFYQRDRYNPTAELFTSQRDEPVRRVRDYWFYAEDDYWLVTRHADVRRVLGDAETFGMRDPDRPRVLPHELVNMDPPEHTRLRRILTPGFTAHRIRGLVPLITSIVDDHLTAMAASGAPADLVRDFALPIPSLVICELLGVPPADRADFQGRTRTVNDLTLSMDARLAAGHAAHEYMAELVAAKRRAPGDDLISLALTEHADAVTDAELVGAAEILLIGGHETTASTLGLGTLVLLDHPEQADRLRATADDDPVLDRAVEEVLRYLAVITTPFLRIARRDTELGGVAIAAGDKVVCQLSVANRDPALGADMNSFDIARAPTSSHVTFGHGIHHCIGAPLARAELRVALPALLRRFPGLRSEMSSHDAPYHTRAAIFGLDSLPVTW